MTLQIKQTEEYLGNDYWSWKVWLSGDDRELAQVDSVIWQLHPSFSPSEVETNARDDNFALEAKGWGTFEITAMIKSTQADSFSISHELQLTYPEDASETTKSKARGAKQKQTPNRLFLTYPRSVFRTAKALSKKLSAEGLQVFDDLNLPVGTAVESGVEKLIEGSSVVVVLVEDDEIGQFTFREIQFAQRRGIAVLVVSPTTNVAKILGSIDRGQITYLESELNDLSRISTKVSQMMSQRM
jgi:transcription initiation factor IIF auxiliary subunit